MRSVRATREWLLFIWLYGKHGTMPVHREETLELVDQNDNNNSNRNSNNSESNKNADEESVYNRNKSTVAVAAAAVAKKGSPKVSEKAKVF